MRRFFTLIILFAFTAPAWAQPNLYAIDTIQRIEITFQQSNWDYMLDTAKYGAEGYTLAAQVKVNGVIFNSVGVKYKGNSSYDSSRVKNPLHIKLDYIHGNASYYGYAHLKLSNGFADPSSVREVLSYKILRNYMHAPLSNFAQVYVNGTYMGLYSSAQSINKDFLSEHFYSTENSFFKCNPVTVVNGHLPNLVYLGTDSTNYYDRYEIESTIAWKELIQLCDTITNAPAYIDSVIDVDRVLWMLAFNDLLVNLDSYSGAYAQNYYLYKDNSGRFNPILWDLNMCFGGFQGTGSANLSISGMQQMTPLLHASNPARPLIMRTLAIPEYKRMYLAHMKTIWSEYVSNGLYATEAQNLMTIVDTAVAAESYSIYTYPQFQQSLNTNNGNIPGIVTLMSARDTYLASTTEFLYTEPSITGVTASTSLAAILDSVWISCTVTNSDSVQLGYRDQIYKIFKRVPMFDDGLHHDGAAGDNVYGAMFIASSALMQYYVYAENASIGKFSPARAEHEFYSLQVVVQAASTGEVVINEFLAVNQAGVVDEAGQHEDWIELYNTTANPLSLYGLYLSDDINNHLKYAFPQGTIIPANGYLTIWADEDASTSSSLHCNFKLTAGGESILLCTPTLTLDSVSYGIMNADQSMGRCPNGSGNFAITNTPTYNAYNDCVIGVAENNRDFSVKIYPNPANDQFVVSSSNPMTARVALMNISGQTILFSEFENDKANIQTENLAPGIYLVRLLAADGSTISTAKVSVVH